MSKINYKKIKFKKNKEPITCLTAYSKPHANILDGRVDLILIGDSLGTTLYGMKNTRSVSLEMMKNHGKAVVNNTKSFIGHAMGAAGALELLGNIPAFDDGIAHATINLDSLDSRVPLTSIVANEPQQMGSVSCILNNSFGMLGINSALIVKKYEG